MATFWLSIIASGLLSATTLVQAADTQRLDIIERRVQQITPLIMKVDELQRENSQLRGQLEELQHQMESMRRQNRDLYLDIDQRLADLRMGTDVGQKAAVAKPVETDTPAVVDTSVNVQSDPLNETASYDQAYALLRPNQRKYPEAISAFRAFLLAYPNGELADNAQYWLAEAAYVMGNNDLALIEFRKLLRVYPDSPKVPGALLKTGYILDAKGESQQAQTILKQVVTQYSGSSVADMAEHRLQRIQRGGY